ncbi:MAG: transcription/translation regulatory transformer protein RfaH [Methyloligellaceae bacterium]
MKHWYVVYTQTRGEERALWHLRNQGFRCFLPRCRKIRRHARKTLEALEPLFPRYLFTQFDPDGCRWRSINGTRGVIQLLTDGMKPLAVPDAFVERLLAQADADGVTPLTVLGMFWKGQKVRVKSGPFAGQTGEVDEIPATAQDRVQILLGMLGAQFRLQMPAHALETA